jgi:hypothetical protein
VGVERAYASDGDYNMIPYNIVRELVGKHGITDVLLMVKDVAIEVEGHIDRLGDAPLQAKAWRQTIKILANAVRELPKVSGIK